MNILLWILASIGAVTLVGAAVYSMVLWRAFYRPKEMRLRDVGAYMQPWIVGAFERSKIIITRTAERPDKSFVTVERAFTDYARDHKYSTCLYSPLDVTECHEALKQHLPDADMNTNADPWNTKLITRVSCGDDFWSAIFVAQIAARCGLGVTDTDIVYIRRKGYFDSPVQTKKRDT